MSEALTRFLKGPARIGAFGFFAVVGGAQLLDMRKEDLPKRTHDNWKQEQKIRDEEAYEAEMEEAYQKGLFLNYKADAVHNKYQPGLPGDPNYNLVQSLFEHRNNHTRM